MKGIEGGGMASSPSFATTSALLLLLLLSLSLSHDWASAATTHVVGDNQGWAVPDGANFYADWASKQTFAVGDKLVFKFPAGRHNVIQVPKSGYDACSTQGQIGDTVTDTPATITLNSTGTHYYLCGVGPHCSLGQKVTITAGVSPPPTATTAGTTSPGPSGAPPPSSATISNALDLSVFAALMSSSAALLLSWT